ncbi:MAG: hypothetical protein HGB03_02635 [Candidatus Yonathbacteria bacterium]|nr:hypothetical protein [Candidatus Yonathbacteria bacterium]NTW47462.1 hypothetical protein [Candidatus Yonathbacteria bacterium]
MVTASQTSFIPKQSFDQVKKKRNTGTWLLVSLSGFVLALSLVAAAGVFFYERMLTTDVADMRDRLERMRSAFEPTLVQELKRLDERLSTLNAVLGGHVAFSEFFSVLEQNTLQTVRFRQFTYQMNTENGAEVTLSGEATSYSSVALQSDVFGKNRYFHDPIFSDMTLDNKGNVTFNVTFILDDELIKYDVADAVNISS